MEATRAEFGDHVYKKQKLKHLFTYVQFTPAIQKQSFLRMIEIRENVWTIPIQPETWEKTRDICQTDESVRIQIFDIYVLDDQTNIILWDDLAIMLKCGK